MEKEKNEKIDEKKKKDESKAQVVEMRWTNIDYILLLNNFIILFDLFD